jgi:hybrid polyketide synthase/nonribosomal peptide synthetase ACE1
LALYLVRNGATHIYLTSRSATKEPWTPDEDALIAAASKVISKKGSPGNVMVCRVDVDVTNRLSLRRFRQRVRREAPPVAGIVHGAMVLDDKTLADMDSQSWSRVMKPKTEGLALMAGLYWDLGEPGVPVGRQTT